MAKKVNPVTYRYSLFRHTSLMYGSYSLKYFTKIFVKLISVYYYLIQLFNNINDLVYLNNPKRIKIDKTAIKPISNETITNKKKKIEHLD